MLGIKGLMVNGTEEQEEATVFKIANNLCPQGICESELLLLRPEGQFHTQFLY